jgi:putative ABC transport system permease protein
MTEVHRPLEPAGRPAGTVAWPLESLTGLAARLGRQWWPQLAALAAACGVVATTIAGALAVGGAMQAGLRSLALGRLGRIDAAVLGEDFFTPGLADSLGREAGGPRQIVPAIVMPATAARADGTTTRITLLACDDPAALGFEPAPPPVEPGGLVVNEQLAAAVGIAAGEPLILRLPSRSSVPADSPLGRRTGESAGRRLTVTAVLPPQGIGEFSLRPVQATAPLAVASLAEARRILGRDDAVNAIFAVGMPPGVDAAGWLRERLRPGLADYGLAIEPAAAEPPSLRLVSRRLMLPAAVDAAAATTLAPLGGHPTLVFLANAIRPPADDPDAPPTPTGDRGAVIPYSTILGIDTTTLPVGDLVDDRGEPLAAPTDDGIIIDRWVADDLAAQGSPVGIGDRLRIEFFEPETLHGRVIETAAELTITGIAAMRGAATARGVVPEVAGITDEESIADWDPPFPFDSGRVRTTPPHDEDDRYWQAYGPTPKAFVSLATARRLAAGRFGDTTAWLVPRENVSDPDALAALLAAAIPPEAAGLRVVPLRAEAVAASSGSTPFGSLFLALSSFVVAAGLLLVWLLFSLLVAARAKDLGILSAVGFSPRRIAAVLVVVAAAAAAVGVAAGTLLGSPWATALLRLLARAWTIAVEAGSARVFTGSRIAATPLVAGGVAALAISLAAVVQAARLAGRLPPLHLLRGGERSSRHPGRRWRAWCVAGIGLGGGLVVAACGRWATPQAAIGLFFAAGFLALAGLLACVWLWLSAAPSAAAARTLAGLARRNLGFAPGRAFSVAAIVAAATFLIVAVSSFAQRPPADPADRHSPTGGWSEIVAFGAATGVDPADPAARAELGLSSAEQAVLAGCEIARLRSTGGDDAACTNLYATLQPTVLGVGPAFIDRGGFSFAGHAPPTDPTAAANPWTLLRGSPGPAGGGPTRPIPAILDQATAQWGLKLGGVGAEFTLADDAGRPLRFVIVGLLEPGILQGFVIIAERDFERAFPDRSGYRMALVDARGVPAGERPRVPAALSAAWADAGVTVVPALRRLASLQAVQNTFLAGFQALGTLGLLLGTAGVAAVQLQGMFERIGSLALLRAVGFTLARVRRLLVLETVLMVALGLAVGAAAALLAVAPALASGQARVPLAWIAATSGLAVAAAAAAAAVTISQAVIPARPRAE